MSPYYYLGGELHALKYGGLGSDRERWRSLLAAEERFILASQGSRDRRIWVDLYGTVLDREAIALLVDHLEAIRPKTFRLCLVGCSALSRRRLRTAMRTHPELRSSTRYFDDPEDAKRWLIGEAV